MAPIEQPGTKYNSMSQSSHFKYLLIVGDQEVGRHRRFLWICEIASLNHLGVTSVDENVLSFPMSICGVDV